MKIAEIAEALAEKTNPALAPAWDPVGLQLGDPEGEASRVAVCHEVNDEVIEVVRNDEIDLLVTYHPLLFEPTNRILAGRSAGARAYALISARIGLLVTHTDFDSTPGGSADALAELLDLRDVEPFGVSSGDDESPIGRVGEFENTLGALDAMLSDAFGHAGLRISGDRDQEVEHVAVVPGSGSHLIEEAAQVAQALVTGDVPHHRAVLARDLGLAIADPGHIATERPGMQALVEMMTGIVDSEIVDLTHLNPRTWS